MSLITQPSTIMVPAFELSLGRNDERLWLALQRSLAVATHLDYLLWMQQDVRPFIPHEILVAAWGGFDDGRTEYDVVSPHDDVRTSDLHAGIDLAPLVRGLHARWRATASPWFVANGLDLEASFEGRQHPFVARLAQMHSVLVHGTRDRRTGQDLLYLFFDSAFLPQHDAQTLLALLPQIDATHRRIECLVPTGTAPTACDRLSAREREILGWITRGKTNEEIAFVLGISLNTVKNHVKRVFRKLQVSSRAQAVARLNEPPGPRVVSDSNAHPCAVSLA
jgi:transcriptional regulator EpsA